MTAVTTLGALVALTVAVVLILRKVPPAYGMMAGALAGGIIGGAGLGETVALMIGGAQGITTAVMRILAAGVLAGVLIESGAAAVVAQTVVAKLGGHRALAALCLATLVLTAAGVFVDVAVITVAPIALVLAQQTGLSKPAVLLAMIGGGKAGNLMSPNPNAIAAADAFGVPLTSLMAAGIVPTVFGAAATCFLAKRLAAKGSRVAVEEIPAGLSAHEMPPFWAAAAGPLTAVALLALRPLAGISIDPLIALPAGGLAGALLMGKIRRSGAYAAGGLAKMMPVAVMLLGTGALAGVIANSGLKTLLIDALAASGLPPYVLAPVSGALMSLATASTTAGTVVASGAFGGTLTELGVAALAGAAMIHAGATVFDHMPHGSFFHATGGSVGMAVRERLKLMPYESAVGLVMAVVSTLVFGVSGWF
ncbi:GntP family permease [Neisseria leonii]|uniref:GntP family permease n=1 Tax=Neisseria leonii TaxID=2995413 RepID=UPI0030CC5FA9